MRNLDRDVTVVDPRDAETEMVEDFKGIRSMEDLERVAANRMEKRLQEGEDVPLVEDFPLAPEEETLDFQHLAMTLNLRFVRAYEHWCGNTHLTLSAIIMRTFQENTRG